MLNVDCFLPQYWANQQPERTAVIWNKGSSPFFPQLQSQSMTWSQLNKLITQISDKFRGNVTKNNIIAYCGESRFCGLLSYLAVIALGGRIVMLNPALKISQKNAILTDIGVDFLITDQDFLSLENLNNIGFVDDDMYKHNRLMNGFRILGNREDIPMLVARYKVEEIIIAMPSVKRDVIREIMEICSPLKCKINTLPGMYQLLDDEVLVSHLHPISIEDLLERDEIHLDTSKVEPYLKDKVVLVTGAGGSIGSEICRQVLRVRPKKLLLLGHGENSIYLIHQELRSIVTEGTLVPIIADIRDKNQLDQIFTDYEPDVVFHAAAHKHVPLMEIQPIAAVLNNIYGTRNVADVAGAHGVERFVMISTDKAVNPTSVMGATKRVAEKVVLGMNHKYDTKFITVRFGNVLGSRGSVIPLFRKQIEAGGPVTVTDPEMTRYFMTIPEASQLVLQAGAMGNGGEVFLLDMGEPVKIVDLAKNMIRLSGFEPDKDIRIEFTGLRPGEKLYEELLTAEEGTNTTTHKKIFEAALEDVNQEWLSREIDRFETCKSDLDVINVLQDIVPTYHPNHNV